MASFVPSNPPTNLKMVDITSAMNSLGGPAKQCRFAVRITPVGTDNILTQLGYKDFIKGLTLMIQSTELPGRGFDYAEVRYYGPSKAFPRQSKYGESLDMSILCRAQGFERQLFDDWLEIINPTNIFDFNYAKQYYCQVDVFQLSEVTINNGRYDQTAMYQWSLHNAWPYLVNPQKVTWADNDILRLDVAFSYQYWTRPGRDTAPGGTPLVLQP
jgi:hypothetical protein